MKRETVNGAELHCWTPEEISAAMSRGEILLVDVRTPQEFAFERIPGAVLSPLQEFAPQNLPEPGGSRTVIFHCGSGVRSRRSAEAALEIGWPQADHMEGGFARWKRSGLPYIGTDINSGGPKRITP